jgi:hypothetical protein
MSTTNLPGCKRLQALKADNLTAISEPIVYKMREPLRLTAPWPPRPVTGIVLPYFNKSRTNVVLPPLIQKNNGLTYICMCLSEIRADPRIHSQLFPKIVQPFCWLKKDKRSAASPTCQRASQPASRLPSAEENKAKKHERKCDKEYTVFWDISKTFRPWWR